MVNEVTKYIPFILDSTITSVSHERNFVKKCNSIVFQGDSITDSKRDRAVQMPNIRSGLGNGFVYGISKQLGLQFADNPIEIFNKGISGNTTNDLLTRWDEDCIELKPDLLSILIGVNDYWHKRSKNNESSLLNYSRNYEHLIRSTKQLLPETQLIICEPFILSNTNVVNNSWLKPFSEYQQRAKHIAAAFDAVWIPYQRVFDEAVKYAPEHTWLLDGVHPTKVGEELMAQAWLKCIFQA